MHHHVTQTEMIPTTRPGLREDGSVVDVPDFSVARTGIEEPMKLKDLIREIGITDFQEDEYDVPTFLRKQAD